MKLFDHQQRILDRDPHKWGLFLGTGGGKTLLACMLAEGDTLVICPKTQTQDGTWENGWAMARQMGKTQTGELRIISKERFKLDGAPACTTLILDEAHTMAGIKPNERSIKKVRRPDASQIYLAVMDYIQRVKPRRIYQLTATPQQNPMTVYGLAQMVGVEWDYHAFVRTFHRQIPKKWGPIWIVDRAQTEARRRYQHNMMARAINKIGTQGRLQDWFDVPEQTYKTHYVGVTKEQQSAYRALRTMYPDPLVQALRRHRLEQGLFDERLQQDDVSLRLVQENKADAIHTYMIEFGHVVVFAKYIDQIDMLRDRLKKEWPVITMTGKDSDRGKLIAAASAAKQCCFIAQSQLSAGWELPSYPCMIFASEDYASVHRTQAEGRILRANYLKKNLYVTLLAGKMDERVRSIIAQKGDFDEAAHAYALAKEEKL
jgi:hypothetical protein